MLYLCGTYVPLSFSTMTSFLKASSNGKLNDEEQLCQGAASQNIVPKIRGPAKESRNGEDATESTILLSSKEYAHSKWASGSHSRCCDAETSAKQKAKSLRKKMRALARKGRLGIENQSEDEDSSDAERVLLELQEILPDTSSDLLQMVAVQIAFILNICACETAAQYSAATLQMIVSVATARPAIVQSAFVIVDRWYDCRSEDDEIPEAEDSLIEDQADPWYMKLKGHLVSVKEGGTMYASIPVWKQLSRCFVLSSLIGLLPDSVDDTSSFLKKGLYYWSKNAASEMKTESYFEMILESAIFACDFINSVVTKDFSTILSPSDLQVRTAELLGMMTSFKNGTLDTLGYTEGKYADEVHKAIIDLKVFVKNLPHGQARNAFSGLLARMVAAEVTVKQTMANVKMRPAAPIIVFYGDSHVGKSGCMYRATYYLGALLKFDTEDANIWYKQKGDAFDSGMTDRKSVV